MNNNKNEKVKWEIAARKQYYSILFSLSSFLSLNQSLQCLFQLIFSWSLNHSVCSIYFTLLRLLLQQIETNAGNYNNNRKNIHTQTQTQPWTQISRVFTCINPQFLVSLQQSADSFWTRMKITHTQSQPHENEKREKKLNPTVWTIRWVLYFLSLLVYSYRASVCRTWATTREMKNHHQTHKSNETPFYLRRQVIFLACVFFFFLQKHSSTHIFPPSHSLHIKISLYIYAYCLIHSTFSLLFFFLFTSPHSLYSSI